MTILLMIMVMPFFFGLATMPYVFGRPSGRTLIDEFYRWVAQYFPDKVHQIMITVVVLGIIAYAAGFFLRRLGGLCAIEQDQKNLETKLDHWLKKKEG